MSAVWIYCYGYFVGHGLDILANELDAADPFALSAAKIVERVLTLGYQPDVEHERQLRFPTLGGVTVHRAGQRFLVSVDRASETIVVQEVRVDPYERER